MHRAGHRLQQIAAAIKGAPLPARGAKGAGRWIPSPRTCGERGRVRGSFRYDREKPSISLSAQLIASSNDWRCCVTLAINFVKVAWANIWVPILRGAG